MAEIQHEIKAHATQLKSYEALTTSEGLKLWWSASADATENMKLLVPYFEKFPFANAKLTTDGGSGTSTGSRSLGPFSRRAQ